MTTIEEDVKTFRRYTRQEAAAILRVKDSILKTLVSKRAVPHQRTGEPGPYQRGVWFTYDDILETGRMLPDLLSGRQANSRAEDKRNEPTPNPEGIRQQVESGADVVVSESLPDELLEAFRNVVSLRA